MCGCVAVLPLPRGPQQSARRHLPTPVAPFCHHFEHPLSHVHPMPIPLLRHSPYTLVLYHQQQQHREAERVYSRPPNRPPSPEIYPLSLRSIYIHMRCSLEISSRYFSLAPVFKRGRKEMAEMLLIHND